MARITLFIGLSCCLVLSACSGPPIESDLQEYRNRVASILGADFPQLSPSLTLTFPNAKALRVEIPEVNIKMRDFYALDSCPVSTLIAQRNTPLGKVQLPSTRLVYEQQLLAGMQACFEQSDSEIQRKQLQDWMTVKRQSTALIWTQMVQRSSEIKRSFSDNESLLQDEGANALSEYKQALGYVVATKDTKDVDQAQLENALNSLRLNPLLAKLWRTQRLLTTYLADMTVQINSSITDLDCSRPADKEKVTYLSNVFGMFFVERIQPFAGNLNQIHYTLSPTLQKLMNDPSVSAAFAAYLQDRNTEFGEYQSAMRAHVALWQTLLKRCQIGPSDI